MAMFALNGRMKVKTIKANIKKTFGLTLRVYMSPTCKGRMADDEATLASIRAEGVRGGEMNVLGGMRVDQFEKKFAGMYGIGVQVANADNTALVDNSLTLAAAGKYANVDSKSCGREAAHRIQKQY